MALRATKRDEDARCGRTLSSFSSSCAVAGRGVFAVLARVFNLAECP
jgi:hypothetical protein